MLNRNQREIKKFIESRGIIALTHFTHIDNLESILNYGLLSLDDMKIRKISYNYNDEQRLEGKSNATCLSISFPNYKMFYKYRCQKQGEWCVLALDPKILYKKKCLFCISNAASSSELSRNDSLKSNISGLKKLFYDPNFYRDSVNLPTRYTTDPQAEVLVLDPIEPNYIKSVHFDRKHREAREFMDKFSHINFYITPKAFSYRYDYINW